MLLTTDQQLVLYGLELGEDRKCSSPTVIALPWNGKTIRDSAVWQDNPTGSVEKAVEDAVFLGAQTALDFALKTGKRVTDAAAHDLDQARQGGKSLCAVAVELADHNLTGANLRPRAAGICSLEVTQKVGDGSIAALEATLNALEFSVVQPFHSIRRRARFGRKISTIMTLNERG